MQKNNFSMQTKKGEGGIFIARIVLEQNFIRLLNKISMANYVIFDNPIQFCIKTFMLKLHISYWNWKE